MKNRLSQWYDRTAIQQIHPVDVSELASQRYSEKWDRVGEETLQKITQSLYKRIWQLESPQADCLLYDTTTVIIISGALQPGNVSVRAQKDFERRRQESGPDSMQ